MAILAECPRCHKVQSRKNRKCKCGMSLERRKLKYHIVGRVDGKLKWWALTSLKVDPYSLDDAKDVEAKLRTAKREGRLDIFQPKKQSSITYEELTKWYLKLEKVKDLASFKTIEGYLKKFNEVFGTKHVSETKPMDLENHQEKRKKEGLKPKTIDDEINYVKTMVNRAFNNDLVTGDAVKAFRLVKALLSGKKKGSNARTRVLTRQELDAIAGAVKEQHTADILHVGDWTGMRAGEIMKLRWPMVNLKERIITLPEYVTKEGKEKRVPIGKVVHEILTRKDNRIRSADDDDHVFTYWDKPIGRHFSTGLKTASEGAGIAWGREIEGGWIFHDLRHTFVTDCRKAGVRRSVSMAIVGHAARDMHDRYDTVDNKDLLDTIGKLEDYRENVRENVSFQEPEKNEAL